MARILSWIMKNFKLKAEIEGRPTLNKTVSQSEAEHILSHTKSWELDEKGYVFVNGGIYPEKEAPKEEVQGIYLHNTDLGDKLLSEEQANVVMAQTFRKKLWKISDKSSKLWKWDEKAQTIVALKKSS